MSKRFDSIHRAIVAHAASLRLDANETALFARQLEDIDSQLFRVEYPELKGSALVPVKSDINPGAEEYTYRSMNSAGRAALLSNYGDDLPRVDVQGAEESTKLKSYGDSYGYSIQDMRRAKMAGISLENERAMAAREVLARKLDTVIFFGDTTAGLTGFANNSGVSLVSPTTGTWLTATGDQILADLLKLERAAFTDSKGIEAPTTIALATSSYAIAATKPIGTDVNKTVLEFFLKQSLFVKEVDHSWQLETANAGGTGPRAICYAKKPEKLQALVPVEFESFAPEPRNLAFVINCHMRAGGTIIRFPGSVRYMDSL
jgi:hypothetical protein